MSSRIACYRWHSNLNSTHNYLGKAWKRRSRYEFSSSYSFGGRFQSIIERLETDGNFQILEGAVSGLDKNAMGLEGAGLRMLQLKQGQSVTWWYQMKVFAALIGLVSNEC